MSRVSTGLPISSIRNCSLSKVTHFPLVSDGDVYETFQQFIVIIHRVISPVYIKAIVSATIIIITTIIIGLRRQILNKTLCMLDYCRIEEEFVTSLYVESSAMQVEENCTAD